MPIRTQHGGYSCLIVDDNRTMLALSSAIINDMGVTVLTAASGKDALHLCKLKRFDIVFLDIELMDISGYKVAAIIRRNKKMASHTSKIVALTASLYSPEDLQRCFDVGMNDCLVKPLKKEILQKRIYSWLTKGDFRQSGR